MRGLFFSREYTMKNTIANLGISQRVRTKNRRCFLAIRIVVGRKRETEEPFPRSLALLLLRVLAKGKEERERRHKWRKFVLGNDEFRLGKGGRGRDREAEGEEEK